MVKFRLRKKSKNYFNTKVDNAGEKYAMLIDFMYKTGIRVTATFNITWSDFTLMNSPYGGDWAQLEVLDKGSKLNTKYLTRAYYDKLHRIFYRNNKDEKLFRLIPIIKDIDNPENIFNKFKLGIVTTSIKSFPCVDPKK